MKVGSFSPAQKKPVLYAMAGDDCSLHHDMDQLTARQQVDHAENQMLTACKHKEVIIYVHVQQQKCGLGFAFKSNPYLELDLEPQNLGSD